MVKNQRQTHIITQKRQKEFSSAEISIFEAVYLCSGESEDTALENRMKYYSDWRQLQACVAFP